MKLITPFRVLVLLTAVAAALLLLGAPMRYRMGWWHFRTGLQGLQVAFTRALDVAESMGWTMVASNAAEGRIEATDKTLWYGFKDDVVIRVAPSGSGSKVDVRSVSRVGRSDIGINAQRIRQYLAKLKT